MISEILPASVAAAESFVDTSAALFPKEEASLVGAVDERRREFVTGRTCARRALAQLGFAPVAITRGARGAPRWPDGVVGSITHCDGYRASAVARAREILCVGIDAEPAGALPDRVFRRIALAQEHVWIRECAAADRTVSWDRLLFSAKEAVYKAWYPLTGRRLEFGDSLVSFDAAHGTFDARFLVPGPTVAERRLSGFTGRWLARDGLVLTAIAITR